MAKIDPWHVVCEVCPLIRCVEETDQLTACPIATAKDGGLSPQLAVAALQMADDDLWAYEELCGRLGGEIEPAFYCTGDIQALLTAAERLPVSTFDPMVIARNIGVSYHRAHYLISKAAHAGVVQKVNDSYGGLYRVAGKPFYRQVSLI